VSHALITIAAPIAVGRISDALAVIQQLGNPAVPDVAEVLGRLDGDAGVHFLSLHAIPPTDEASPRGHLVLEFSADGSEAEALARVVDRIGPRLTDVFRLADDWKGGDFLAYLGARKLRLGVGWTGRTGLAFAGTPGMSVGRIRREAELAQRLTASLETQGEGLSALDRLARIREQVRADAASQWALTTPDALPVAPTWNTFGLVIDMAVSFVKTYLWPFAILWGLIVLARVAYLAVTHAFRGFFSAPPPIVVGALWSGLLWALGALLAIAIPLLIAAAALYFDLRNKEQTDWLDERSPKRSVLHEILARENHYAQNHMVSVTRRKPGFTRRLTSRLAFWLIGALAQRQFQPGHLGAIGTIHFARWVMLPNSTDFVFFSNYGGSWESYLEDFITKAHAGLTAVWSNTVGFPRTENLFQKGATDGERFKRYARHSMLPTPFWFSAYPTLTTDNIRTNAAIRVGLAAAMTNDEATEWLELFGSALRPPSKLETDQIQSLVFGGLGFMPHGHVLTVRLADCRTKARDWLRGVLPHVAFDDGRRLRADAVISLGLGPGALAKAGLPNDALETFPVAYLDGMTGPGRSRILGDDRADDWWWGGSGAPADAAVLIYGLNDVAVAALVNQVRDLTLAGDHVLDHEIPLATVEKPTLEPFGFLDGVSQPVIRGTYRALRNPDSIHLVEPGEFILGYPDNRRNLPPGPLMNALDDPDNRLPIRCDDPGGIFGNIVNGPREIGRNGSFLVIRQLEQDHDRFWSYCEAEAERLHGRLPTPYVITKEFIAAKLLGRWPDGSSLVRNPYQPYTHSPRTHPTQRPGSRPGGHATAIAPAPVAAAVPATVAKAAAAGTSETEAEAKSVQRSPLADNDFLLGAEDPQGLRCPYGAHIRRANPRDSLDPGSQEQLDISNRHRILRLGRRYIAQDGQKPGLLFMCLNGDLERQFEFVQQTWLGSQTFHGLSDERDPLAGNGCPNGFTVPTRDGPVRLAPLSRFVTPRGGGYFFLPGKALLQFLSA
jgi:deferrochelatase/peroxidase EfeB